MRVHILGGGIGGMSAALHLARLSASGVMPRDLEVHVYERLGRYGGKAVSQFIERDGGGRWPGEHGFRFFPNFYRCIVDTLKYVPVTAAHKARRGLDPDLGPTVFDLLESVGEGGAALGGAVHHIPRAQSLDGIVGAITETLSAFQVTPLDIATFSAEITRFLCTCNDRAVLTWEHDTLQGFLGRHDFSPGMVTFLRSLRALSAMRADKGSLRTLFFTATQMIADFDPEYHLRDALLPGPTDYLMLEPWAEELGRLGVVFHPGQTVTGLAFGAPKRGLPSRLTSVTFDGPTPRIDAGADDVFVLALPFEVARPLLVAAPNLPVTLEGVHAIPQRPDNLGDGAEPMVGVQFWLKRDVPIASGHVVYPKARWAITSVSQAQFWRGTFASSLADTFGAPGLEGILSAIVSGWEVESDRIHKAPKDCTSEELAKEVFAQIVEDSGTDLTWADVIDFHVDSDIAFTAGRAHCTTPLWVSPSGSYLHRPNPDLQCGNLFLASDWARTETDVGSMESADEAARRSVAAIAQLLPMPPPEHLLPEVRPFRLWRAIELGRAADQFLFDHGLGHSLDMTAAVRGELGGALRALRDGDVVEALTIVRTHARGAHSAQPRFEMIQWAETLGSGVARRGLDHALRLFDLLDRYDDDGDSRVRTPTSVFDLLGNLI